MVRDSNTEVIVYELVCSKPGMCTYDIEKKLDMTGGRIRHALSMLGKKGLIKFKFDRRKPRIRKLAYPVDRWNLLPKSFKNEIKVIVKK